MKCVLICVPLLHHTHSRPREQRPASCTNPCMVGLDKRAAATANTRRIAVVHGLLALSSVDADWQAREGNSKLLPSWTSPSLSQSSHLLVLHSAAVLVLSYSGNLCCWLVAKRVTSGGPASSQHRQCAPTEEALVLISLASPDGKDRGKDSAAHWRRLGPTSCKLRSLYKVFGPHSVS
jgi:hypothetical protein